MTTALFVLFLFFYMFYFNCIQNFKNKLTKVNETLSVRYSEVLSINYLTFNTILF